MVPSTYPPPQHPSNRKSRIRNRDTQTWPENLLPILTTTKYFRTCYWHTYGQEGEQTQTKLHQRGSSKRKHESVQTAHERCQPTHMNSTIHAKTETAHAQHKTTNTQHETLCEHNARTQTNTRKCTPENQESQLATNTSMKQPQAQRSTRISTIQQTLAQQLSGKGWDPHKTTKSCSLRIQMLRKRISRAEQKP